MMYNEFMNVASGKCIEFTENTKQAYLLPDYRYVLRASGFTPDKVEDFEGLTWDEVGESLKLEVQMYNAENNSTLLLANLINDIITTDIAPLAQQEQNELFKNIIEYLKENNAREKFQKVTLGNDKEEQMGQLHQLFPNVNFEKKEP